MGRSNSTRQHFPCGAVVRWPVPYAAEEVPQTPRQWYKESGKPLEIKQILSDNIDQYEFNSWTKIRTSSFPVRNRLHRRKNSRISLMAECHSVPIYWTFSYQQSELYRTHSGQAVDLNTQHSVLCLIYCIFCTPLYWVN